ncbi:unnamed protein product [Rotaria magnacalcarata]|uniref:Uncharacterized protein n=1 Tax=Rotaria magnacalcarata TaxID=392030 RepID=A0A814ZVF5_9BILA|nr:unnamed protein product [Rotaria magnacalcarata]CAF1680942.1 unnamed protein product [Rotaria magnacalcarata]CAF1922455.1 unnamed protein product [Rotaria magnacalcarata]CAF3878086.1 unnamed protein product [Rotaria magnacalcarata]CAF3907672.1 unnamed protein product [Rotaria magnacalcarata]
MDHIHQKRYGQITIFQKSAEDSAYSDDDGKILHGEASSSASIGFHGFQTSAEAAASIVKVGSDKWSFDVGHGSAFACATQGTEGVFCGAGAELNAVSLHHENVQARVGLDVSTGVGFSTTDVSATVGGVWVWV